MAVIDSGSFRYQKNWFRKDRTTHDRLPNTHIRNVRAGIDGSSVVGTVIATCLIGEFSSGSISSSDFDDEDDEDEDASSFSFSATAINTNYIYPHTIILPNKKKFIIKDLEKR